MQNIYDKKWFWGLWEYCGYLVIEILYETTWKWTMYFKYINLWVFDVVLPFCHDIGDYPVFVMMSMWRPYLCDDYICVTTPSVWWQRLCDDIVCVTTTFMWRPHLCDDPVCLMTPFVWRPCLVALGEISCFEIVLDIYLADSE